VILAGKQVEFSADFRAVCRRRGFEPEAIVSVFIDQKTQRSAGRWVPGVGDVEPWKAQDIITGAEFTVTLADGSVNGFYWDSDQPWASMPLPKGSVK
jgi:hypothetical protein